MEIKLYVCQIIEYIIRFQYGNISFSKFLEETFNIYEVIKDLCPNSLTCDFHLYWDQLEEIFSAGYERQMENTIYNEILPSLKEKMKDYL